ncbi:related to Integral membrane protein [Serendipita indica DSM 11827]|uniref:Related to Integral membrane protein n=1 Tax=Serendipita indica (strain DSM 11827) TaxID=1109443 RepID=G4TEZ3_SERID|nr:related to Integral membrane protein [Serendipita indica DSM 11827]
MKRANIPHPLSGPPGVRYLLAIRGISGFFGIFGIYYSLIYLSLSDAIVITFLGPTTTAIAGYLILGEALSRREIVAGALSFMGVILIARPPFLFGQSDQVGGEKGTPAQRLIAVGVALLGVLGGTGAFISIRAVGKRAHPLHSVSFFSIYSCLVSVIGMIVLRVPLVLPRSLTFVGLVFSIGFFGFFTQLFLTMGLQRETAGRASLGIYVQILFAVAAERWIFHTIPPASSIAGIVIIISCATFVALTKSSNTEKEQKARGSADVDLSTIRLERGSLEGSDAEREGLVSSLKEEWPHNDRQDIEHGRRGSD